MLFNAVIISVLIMVVLSLLRVNVIFSILIAALSAGLLSGLGIVETTEILIAGMDNQMNTALSYVLLGIFSVMIGLSGITTFLLGKMVKVFNGRKTALLLALAGIASLSQNVVPVHIAFIPILIPPTILTPRLLLFSSGRRSTPLV